MGIESQIRIMKKDNETLKNMVKKLSARLTNVSCKFWDYKALQNIYMERLRLKHIKQAHFHKRVERFARLSKGDIQKIKLFCYRYNNAISRCGDAYKKGKILPYLTTPEYYKLKYMLRKGVSR